MPPANTDYFKKVQRKFSTTLASTLAQGGLSAALSSTTGLPTDTAVTITIDRVNSNGVKTPTTEEVMTGVVNGSNVQNLLRGKEGTTDQEHNAGAVVEMVWTETVWNDAVDGILVSHDQDGSLKTDAVDDTEVIADGVITEAKHANGYLHGSDGYIDATDTWTYASATTFTIAGVDRTAMFPKGTRIRLTQTTDKYFYVVGTSFSTNTTVTVTGGTDYTLANAAITNPRYSYMECPQGFPTYFNYSPTLVGFSANPTSTVYRFKINGNVCRVDFRQGASGTSNATSFTLTAPVTAATITNMVWFGLAVDATDNSANLTTPSRTQVSSAGTTIVVLKDASGAAWTASGSKRASGSIEYEF